MKTKFSPVEEILADLKKGRMVVITDDENRENEGDIVLAGQFATPEKINFIAQHARGLICAPLDEAAINRLRLFPMERENTDPYKTSWMISVDAAKGVTTGISAQDRARTLRLLAGPGTRAGDLTRPGHIFPLKAKKGGVLTRAGHTEACVDLMRLAGLAPAGVICEIMKKDGSMARLPDLAAFAAKHKLKISTIAALIAYRLGKEKLVERIATSRLPAGGAEYEIRIYKDKLTGLEHVAMILGEIKQPVLVRVHSECLTGDVFGSKRCDCGPQLKAAMTMIEAEGAGVLLYMRQEGRGIGLGNKIRAYSLQDKGYDTISANHALGFKADLRDYGTGAQILCDLGVRSMRLLTNNPKKIVGLNGYCLKVTERVPIIIKENPHNARYLRTKKNKMGHLI
ncbi:MAG TPA: bifunctional 3,4-dihydroxy-2-butanone-4-phosphate synthase/GTP cyclohydrolase II [Elusimicrobiales bacterium]|nr:bifunctional 3,4-dihydroxy-2-butanone-4-phosphate synthase/GTP cyclohydrolase II [Elusimicrobiales bacterium]